MLDKVHYRVSKDAEYISNLVCII